MKPGQAVLLIGCVRLSATLRTAAPQASLSFIVSQSLLKLTSIESVMPANRLGFSGALGTANLTALTVSRTLVWTEFKYVLTAAEH